MKKLPKNRIPVSLSIPFDELSVIDEKAAILGLTRSEFVLAAIRHYMGHYMWEEKKEK